MFIAILVVVFFSLVDQKSCGYYNSHQLGYHNGIPNTVNIQNQGEQHNGCSLEYQRSQKGNDCRSDAVVERGEKTGAEDGIAHKEK